MRRTDSVIDNVYPLDHYRENHEHVYPARRGLAPADGPDLLWSNPTVQLAGVLEAHRSRESGLVSSETITRRLEFCALGHFLARDSQSVGG
jgi:hypothetical protein